ncbi:MAG: trans-sulfuration enzyme family protein [Spirochaetota bacterium]
MSDRGRETEAIRTQSERTVHREHSVPLYLTSSFVFDTAEQGKALFSGEESGLVYSRYGNPNTDELVEKLCRLEQADDGLATATGMAAMFASIAGLVKTGDHIVASRALFGSTVQILSAILPRWGVETTYVDPHDLDQWRDALRPETRLLFAETPSNPGLALIDIAALAEIAHEKDLILSVDNCFASPVIQRPIVLGADLVTHSTTKFMDGQGRVLGGAIVGRQDLMADLRFFVRQTGPALSPFNAWVVSKSLETLHVRVERHCANALAIAEHLEADGRVNWVRYPFLASHPQHELARRQMTAGGGLVTFEVPGGETGGMEFLNALEMITRSSNLGDTRSIATHPATTTHSRLTEEERRRIGITPGTIRLSVGLESVADIVADLDRALVAGTR